MSSRVTAKDPKAFRLLVARKMTANLIEDATALLSRVEKGEGELKSEECFQLFESVGRLRFRTLLRDFPDDEVETSVKLARRLENRLGNIAKETVVFDAGVTNIITKLEEHITEAEAGHYRKLGYIEFDAEIIDVRDRLGYALTMAENVGLALSSDARSRIESADKRLRQIIPENIEYFRKEMNDSPYYRIGAFPDFFWWREWNLYRSDREIDRANQAGLEKVKKLLAGRPVKSGDHKDTRD